MEIDVVRRIGHEGADIGQSLVRAEVKRVAERAENVARILGGLTIGPRVVLVGNKISPGNPVTKPDGTIVRTLWGKLAWQLGGKKAFARIQADDERATSPGNVLRELVRRVRAMPDSDR